METWQEFFGEDYLRFAPFILTPERTAREVEGIQSLLPRRAGLRILDLGCGQGRIAVPLAQAGHSVCGLDGSPVMLRAARRAAEEAGVAVELAPGDMRRLPWPGGFDAVINVGTAFGYLLDDADNRAILAEVHRVLKPGGVFILDTENRERAVAGASARMWFELGGMVVWSERTFEPVTGRYSERLSWMENGGRRQAVHTLRLYTAAELVAMLRQAGLEVRGVFASLSGAAAYALDSPRLVVAAERSAPPDPATDSEYKERSAGRLPQRAPHDGGEAQDLSPAPEAG